MHSKCLLSLLLGCIIAQYALAAEPASLIIAHVTVIDATGSPPQPDVTLTITGDRITAIGRSAKVPLPANAVVVDATGKFLIPGLWDMHVHWYDKEYLPLFTANGVTGIRMMWGTPEHHEWRKAIESRALLGPRLLIASTIVDGPKPVWPGSITASNAAQGRQAVAQAKQSGADFVKVYSLLPREAYFAIADQAKKQRIPFDGHVPFSVSVEEASSAGQRCIEHLTGVLSACSSREPELLKAQQEFLAKILSTNQALDLTTRLRRESITAMDSYSASKARAVFAGFRRRQTWQCPTLTVLRLETFGADPSQTEDARIKYMPPDLRSYWNVRMKKRFLTDSPELQAFGQRFFQKHLEIVGAMHRAGVDILAGTDTLNPYCFPGFSLHDELALLVRAGLTPMQALQAATRNPARFMGREKELGTIEKGKLADLVLLNANPLTNITNTRAIDAVVCRGQYYSRSALDQLLNGIEAIANRASSSTNQE